MPFTAIRIPIGAADNEGAQAGADATVERLAVTQIEAQKQVAETHVQVVGAFESEEQALAVAQRAIDVLGFPVYLVDPATGEEMQAEPAAQIVVLEETTGSPVPLAAPAEDQA